MKTEILVWILMSLSIMFCIPGCKTKSEKMLESERLKQKVGEAVFHGLKDPTRVTYFAVYPKPGSHTEYQASSDERELTEDLRWLLQETLTDDQTYLFNKTKLCRFVPEIGFRFQGEREVVVLMSFACRQVKIISGNDEFVLDDDPKHEVLENNFQELLTHLE